MPISQKDFLAKLREKAPQLKDIPDGELINKILSTRPDLVDKIENPLAGDAQSAQAQQKAEDASKSLVNPSTWQGHPIIKQFIQSISDALPGAGAIGGGLLASPETLGMGSIAGGALGAGAGRGLRDIINQALGTENTSPLDKAKNIGADTALTAIMPGVLTTLRYPINTARLAAGSLSNIESKLLPRGLQMLLKSPILDDIATGGKVDKSAWGALQPKFAAEKPDLTLMSRDLSKSRMASEMGQASKQEIAPKIGDIIKSNNEYYQLISMENGKPKVSIVNTKDIIPTFEFDSKTNSFNSINPEGSLPGGGNAGSKGAKLANENLPNDFQMVSPEMEKTKTLQTIDAINKGNALPYVKPPLGYNKVLERQDLLRNSTK